MPGCTCWKDCLYFPHNRFPIVPNRNSLFSLLGVQNLYFLHSSTRLRWLRVSPSLNLIRGHGSTTLRRPTYVSQDQTSTGNLDFEDVIRFWPFETWKSLSPDCRVTDRTYVSFKQRHRAPMFLSEVTLCLHCAVNTNILLSNTMDVPWF